jgi:predicted dehydrogenase
MEKVRWGILGAADIASAVAQGIAKSANGVVAAIASRDIEKARRWAAQHGALLAFGSYDALLRSGEVDAVYNPLPNSLHAAWTIRALEAGLPVLCEKPFTANAAEACEVLRVRDRTGLPVAEAFMHRFHPLYDAVLARIRNGAIGKLVSMHSRFTFYLGDAPSIVTSAELAGGSLMDVGCYPVNLARMIAGCEPTRACAFRHGAEVDNTFLGTLEFPNGMLAHVESSIESFERHRAEITGTHGAIIIESPWNPGDDAGEFVVVTESGSERIATAGGDRYRLEVEDFANAVLTGAPVRWPIEDAVANMAALDALAASARTGAAVSLNGACQ